MSAEAAKRAIVARAQAEGFAAVGVAPPEVPERDRRALAAYLDAGAQGDMAWLADQAARRADPKTLWPDVRAVIALGANYTPNGDPLARLRDPGLANLSAYAWNRDYHDLLKGRLKRIAGWIAATFSAQVKVFVDTAPVMERALAASAGLGWQGKHTNLVSPTEGSWLFLGEIFTDLELTPDAPGEDRCGRCRRCLDICPTDAFPTPYTLDARRCLSYWSIENAGPIPTAFRRPMGNRIYGCDDCLAVCPWNKFAQAAAEPAFAPRRALTGARLRDWLGLEDAAFRRLFSKSPVKRIGRDRFLRNIAIALGNAGDSRAAPALERRLADPAAVVRGAAVWALAQLLPSARFATLRSSWVPAEADAGVRAEWAAGDAA